METKLIENINQFVENYNDLDKDYKVKHNELLVIFDYFKAIINHLYTIMERDKKIIKNISSLFDNNIEIADRSELINKQKYIMNEFETIKQQLKFIIDIPENNTTTLVDINDTNKLPDSFNNNTDEPDSKLIDSKFIGNIKNVFDQFLAHPNNTTNNGPHHISNNNLVIEPTNNTIEKETNDMEPDEIDETQQPNSIDEPDEPNSINEPEHHNQTDEPNPIDEPDEPNPIDEPEQHNQTDEPEHHKQTEHHKQIDEPDELEQPNPPENNIIINDNSNDNSNDDGVEPNTDNNIVGNEDDINPFITSFKNIFKKFNNTMETHQQKKMIKQDNVYMGNKTIKNNECNYRFKRLSSNFPLLKGKRRTKKKIN